MDDLNSLKQYTIIEGRSLCVCLLRHGDKLVHRLETNVILRSIDEDFSVVIIVTDVVFSTF